MLGWIISDIKWKNTFNLHCTFVKDEHGESQVLLLGNWHFIKCLNRIRATYSGYPTYMFLIRLLRNTLKHDENIMF